MRRTCSPSSECTHAWRLRPLLCGPGWGTRSPARVIMLGTLPEAGRIVEALRAGISGWVRKEDSIEHLLAAIRGVMRDETWLPSVAVGPVLRLLLNQGPERPAPRNHPLATLTP